tara:strand:- start:338 stop:640 length:303 start_codon:yes stop_codon:yes gene_type:complete
MANRYVILTAISTHKVRYAIPEEVLSADTDQLLIDKATDAVTAEKVEEFSQEWLGETVIDERICTEEEMLEIFDRENDYLRGWTREEKIEYVRKSLGISG